MGETTDEYFILRLKMIRKECEKRLLGNHKIYLRSNNSNSLVLSELCSSLLAICKIKAIGFGHGKDNYSERFAWRFWQQQMSDSCICYHKMTNKLY